MFEIKEVTKVEATGSGWGAAAIIGSAGVVTWGWAWLLPAAIAC